jgi:hypothetical protein
MLPGIGKNTAQEKFSGLRMGAGLRYHPVQQWSAILLAGTSDLRAEEDLNHRSWQRAASLPALPRLQAAEERAAEPRMALEGTK